jgi:nitroreductase
MLSVADAITGRRSTRAYLDKPVPRATIEKILSIAARAPSGSNIQPWRVWVLQGAARGKLVERLTRLLAAGDPGRREYNYYPVAWREPYQSRRRACGFGLYRTLGIGREDKARMAAQHRENFRFFGAPVGLIFSIDRDMEQGSWLDYGMFLQSIMIAARAEGLETCPQAAFAYFAPVVQAEVGIPAEQMVVCGMALGYADPDAIVNTFVTERQRMDEFTTFLGEP